MRYRARGAGRGAKRAERAATEGTVWAHIAPDHHSGVLLEVNCESDFVARTDDFQCLCHDLAMHVAALDPRWTVGAIVAVRRVARWCGRGRG